MIRGWEHALWGFSHATNAHFTDAASGAGLFSNAASASWPTWTDRWSAVTVRRADFASDTIYSAETM